MTKTRAIRFSKEEEAKIEEFLQKNSFFDFSSLARTAIMNFVKAPTVSIRAIRSFETGSNKVRRTKDGHS
jgi:hypothetical protein